MRHRLRVVRAHVLAWLGLIQLALAISRGRVEQVWVGDSHAAFCGADRFPPLGIGSTTDGRWVWHLGPRLMFSIARDGLKPGVRRAFRLLSRIPRTRQVVWIFSFGEIDIRCHLAPRVAAGDDLDFVDAYVARIHGLLTELQVPRGLVLVPVPPATERFVHESFPVLGTNEERLAVHGVVRKRLLGAVSASPAVPHLLALDLTDALTDDLGWYRTDLHSDGIHANDAGREVVQTELARVLAAVR